MYFTKIHINDQFSKIVVSYLYKTLILSPIFGKLRRGIEVLALERLSYYDDAIVVSKLSLRKFLYLLILGLFHTDDVGSFPWGGCIPKGLNCK